MAFLLLDSEVLWLNFMNGMLGAVVLICCLVVLGAVVYQITGTRKRRRSNARGADREMRAMFRSDDDHTFRVAGLGVTMADGGERAREPEEGDDPKAR